MCWYHANSSPPYPPPCRCQEHREIERFWDNVLVSCKQFSTLPPCRCQAPVPKPKKHREIERFCPKPKKTSRNRKKKDSGTMCWYHVNILLARLVLLGVFSDFSRFLSVLDKIFRFLDIFLILDGFFRILNVFLILDTFF